MKHKPTKPSPKAPLKDELMTTKMVPVGPLAFSELPWWNKLSDEEKEIITEEAKQLDKDLQLYGMSKLAVASRFVKIADILVPLKKFDAFIKAYHFKRRTVWRYITSYRNIQHLPEVIVRVAAARNINIMGETEKKPYGVYTEAMKKLPPPKKPDEAQATLYLEQLENVRRRMPKAKDVDGVERTYIPMDPKDLQVDAYRAVNGYYQKLPPSMSADKKKAWLKGLLSMLLSVGAMMGEQILIGINPPEDFKPVLGRPRLQA